MWFGVVLAFAPDSMDSLVEFTSSCSPSLPLLSSAIVTVIVVVGVVVAVCYDRSVCECPGTCTSLVVVGSLRLGLFAQLKFCSVSRYIPTQTAIKRSVRDFGFASAVLACHAHSLL